MGHVVWRDAAGVFIAMLVSQVFQSSTMFWLFLTKDWSRFSMMRRANGTTHKGGNSNVRD
jgi:MATE family multidrug resistance protein